MQGGPGTPPPVVTSVRAQPLVEDAVWQHAKDIDMMTVSRDVHNLVCRRTCMLEAGAYLAGQIQDELPMLVQSQITRSASRLLTRYVVVDLSQTVSSAMVHILAKELTVPIVAMITKMTVAPVAHAVAATVTQAMQRSPRYDVTCQVKCVDEGEKSACMYCQHLDHYAQDYWASYYVSCVGGVGGWSPTLPWSYRSSTTTSTTRTRTRPTMQSLSTGCRESVCSLSPGVS
jgi:hypothetical protein